MQKLNPNLYSKKIIVGTCIICKNSKLSIITHKIRDSVNHKVVMCIKCGHVQVYPLPSLEEEKKFYDKNMQDKNINYFGTMSEMREKYSYDTMRRVDFVKKNIPKKSKILEVGSGFGFFIEKMEKLGYDITGIEISKVERTQAKRITRATILDVNLLQNVPNIGPFDAVVMFHVLEHIPNPISFLNNVKKLLKKDGKLIVEVPNLNDYQLRLNDEYKKWHWQLAHLNYFTPLTLKKVITKGGFKDTKIQGIQRYSIENMFNWKLTRKPQLNAPTHNLPIEYEWLEKYYKEHLEKSLQSDAIIAVSRR